eukprot:GAHX01001243.1.p1 GENE.GAHX01001243.1~~GAHX01001243.1.p1  ORF type:complete len:383 (-),score=50.82 GAHX01001243.1:57-1205(-)
MGTKTSITLENFYKSKTRIIIGSVCLLIATIAIILICVLIPKSKKPKSTSSTDSTLSSSTSTEVIDNSALDDKEVYDPFPSGVVEIEDFLVTVTNDEQLSSFMFRYITNIPTTDELSNFCLSIPSVCRETSEQANHIVEFEEKAFGKVTDYKLAGGLTDGTLYAYVRIQQILIIGQGLIYHTEVFKNPEIKLDQKPTLRKQLIAITSLLLYTSLEREHKLGLYLKNIGQMTHKTVYKKDYESKQMKAFIRLIDYVSWKSFYRTKDFYINSIARFKDQFFTIRSPEAGNYVFLISSLPALLNLLGPDITKHELSPVLSYDSLMPLSKPEKLGELKIQIGNVKKEYEVLMEVLLKDPNKFEIFAAVESLIRLTTQIEFMNELFK